MSGQESPTGSTLRMVIGGVFLAIVWGMYLVRIVWGIGLMRDLHGHPAPVAHYLAGALTVTIMVGIWIVGRALMERGDRP